MTFLLNWEVRVISSSSQIQQFLAPPPVGVCCFSLELRLDTQHGKRGWAVTGELPFIKNTRDTLRPDAPWLLKLDCLGCRQDFKQGH